MNKVIVMRGLPGSGKSTVAQKLAGETPGAVIVSADDFFNGGPIDTKMLGWAHAHCQKKFVKALQAMVPLIIVDNTNSTKSEIKIYMDKAAEFHYEAEILDVPCDIDTSATRNIHSVPREAIEKMANSLQTSPLDPSWKVRTYTGP